MPTRVLLLTTDSKICGTESMILSLLRHLNRTVYAPYLVTLKGPGDLIGEAASLGVEGENLQMDTVPRREGWRRWREAVRRIQPRIIHSFLFHSNLLARAAHFFHRDIAVISGIRTVYTVKDYGRWYGWLERLTHPWDTLYVANSQHGLLSVREQMGLPESKLVMVPNGLELEDLLDPPETIRETTRFEFGWNPGDLVVGIVAQLRPPKRHDLLIQAVARLKDRYPALRLLIVGQGENEMCLRALALQKGIEKRTAFTGYRSDARLLLRGMDIFALPSDVEGQPVSILEAMEAGLPVLAARSGGIPELVTAGETGLLFEPGHLDDLTQALVRLLESPDLRISMGAAGQNRVQKHFSARQMARRFEGLYERCLKE